MPEIVIDGRTVRAAPDQSVLQVALANGFHVPHFCWHPALSVSGNCRLCVVEVEAKGGSWIELACNMPVAEGIRIHTDSPAVQAQRKGVLQLLTLNHPVDCGICDKAGECTLQDFHYRFNGAPSKSRDPKLRATKFHDLGRRIALDNERCILCLRCVRFVREISRSYSLGVVNRGDRSLLREVEDGSFERDVYSDNVIDLCPVGALLSRDFLYKARVWYLRSTPSVCPGCARGCTVKLWHRKPEWALQALDARQNTALARVTPLENPAVNGRWICNKGRDLARIFERPRALAPMRSGRRVPLQAATDAARGLIGAARRAVALVSNWGSNEELAAFERALGHRFAAFAKTDRHPEPGEPLEDDLLVRRDKNPNTAAARARFPQWPDQAPAGFPAGTDLVLVWGEGFDFAQLPAGARCIVLDAYERPEHARADVFIPLSIQTERAGHYTNFAGRVSAFAPCFAKPASVADAEHLFAALAAQAEVPA